MATDNLAVGFRAYVDGFAYVCLSGTQERPKVVARDRLVFPAHQKDARALCWLRKQVQELLEVHDVSGACVKTIEPMARKKSTQRLYVEAVIIEVTYTISGVVCVPRIKSQLKRDIKHFNEPARYLERILVGSSYLEELNTPRFQEATIAAVAALPKE